MTNGRDKKQGVPYTLSWLPWALGIAVAGLYLLSLNRNLSLLPDWAAAQQMPMGVRALGWFHGAEFLAPVYAFVTWPLRWLPPSFIPLAFNFFSALCGALALGQLARSVALFPHDRTAVQKNLLTHPKALLTSLPLAWLPPVLATVVCALGLTFWEHGTNGTGEMFDLLLFAYVLRSFLEYRLDEKEGRLLRAALVYGLGITNNPAMIAFFPIYLGALVWTRKLQFFQLRFLGRMLLCGLAGLSFYLFLPALGAAAGKTSASFWELLQTNLTLQRWMLTSFPRGTLLLLALTSLVPVFLLSVRWSAHGDSSRVGSLITNFAFHICHAVILFACLWVTLDPGFSPRRIAMTLPFPSSSFTFLPLYYLAALSIGYYSGYLLLIFRPVVTRTSRNKVSSPWSERLAAAGVLALLVIVPTILLQRNLPQIRVTNGPLQSQFGASEAFHLPDDGVILSDDPRRLWILQDWLTRQKRAQNYIFACTAWLNQPDYQHYLHRRYPDWILPTIADDKALIPQTALLNAMEQLGAKRKIAYLHPSFGYYFESFYSEPNGLGSLLTLSKKGALVPPSLSPDCVARNRQFWAEAETGLIPALLPEIRSPGQNPKLTFPHNLYKKLGLKPETNPQAAGLGAYLSRSLVRWGVELQKLGDYAAAAQPFVRAEQLNPQNVVADFNLDFNEKYQRGEAVGLEISKKQDEIFGEARTWEQMLNAFGPYDVPGLAYKQGIVFVQGNLIRQAAQYFDRVRTQVTNDISSRLWLAQINLFSGFPDETIKMVTEVRHIATRLPEVQTNLSDLFGLEAAAYLAKNDDATADRIVATNLAVAPKNFNLLAAACKVYADNRRYTNALALTQRMLEISPTNIACLINQGCFQMEMPDFDRAIESFSQVLTLETNNYRAILYRAIAQLRADRLDAAQKDYETVQRQFPKEFIVDYGLGEIAYRRKDINAAIRHYENYLQNAPAQTAEAKAIAQRLQELKGEPATSPPADAKAGPKSP